MSTSCARSWPSVGYSRINSEVEWRVLPSLVIAAVFLAAFAHAEAPKDVAAPAGAGASEDGAIVVEEVAEAYAHVREQRCACGGRYRVGMVATSMDGGKHLDTFNCTCTGCGKARTFIFDVSGIFAGYALEMSEEAKATTYARLDKKFPKPSEKDIPAFRKLLAGRDPHCRSWVARALAGIRTRRARELLLAELIKAKLLDGMAFEEALASIGPPVVPLVRERIAGRSPKARGKMIDLLGKIRCPGSRKLVEKELRTGPWENSRRCYWSLAKLGYRESEDILLTFVKKEKAAEHPDNLLFWALGRCGGTRSYPVLREGARSRRHEIRLTCLAALGVGGHTKSTEFLLRVAKTDPESAMRYHAIYGLGFLKARDAVPLLLEYLSYPPGEEGVKLPWQTEGNQEKDSSWKGIYDDGSHHGLDIHTGCIAAIGRIGDRRAIPVFKKVLSDDRYYLQHWDVAGAAASLGWRELVPAIVQRLKRETSKRPGFWTIEDFVPALRKLTQADPRGSRQPWIVWVNEYLSKRIMVGIQKLQVYYAAERTSVKLGKKEQEEKEKEMQ